jgi:hypothetical protein
MLVLIDHTASEVLASWKVSERVPVVLGPGPRLRRATELEVIGACHDGSSEESPEGESGPLSGGAGQPTGPTEDGERVNVEVDPWADARQRVHATLERAMQYREALLGPGRLTVARLAEREGVAPARITEATGLLRLPASVLAELREGRRAVPTVKDLMALSRERDADAVVERYRRLCQDIERGGSGRRAGMPKQKGFQHLLARARRYQELLASGQYASMSQLARAEGITHARVGHLLDLLALSPAILEAIDVPVENAPTGLTHEELRKVARMDSHAVQEDEVRRRWPLLLGAK